MKTYRLWFALAAAAILSGCGKEGSDSSSPGSSAASAPAGYVGALAKGQQSATKTADLASLNQAIQLFNAQEGHFPKSLDELVQNRYMGQLPTPPAGMKFAYNATDGTVSLVQQ